MLRRPETRRIRVPLIALISVLAVSLVAVSDAAACTVPGTQGPLAAAVGGGPFGAPGPLVPAQGGNSNGSGPIVGQWYSVLTATSPFQGVYDIGFQQFHDDGTELMISGGVAPAYGNVCIGAWERRPGGQIHLTHMTWNWEGGEPFGQLAETYFLLEVDIRTHSRGMGYSGTWTAASYFLNGGGLVPDSEAGGTVEGTRINVN